MPSRPPVFRPKGWQPAPRKRPQVQDPFYGSAEWKRLREACLARDGHRCTDPHCTTPERGANGRLIADHIVPRREGGEDALPNLRTLCSACDNRRHGRRGG
ncbi:HNH endonuclease [Azospirillum sp. HJ39]|uniref:HNH endonuclease n=1 Tax=Azospirillum sp. HJ39 TaxID=3159496 RepID=UPI003555D635